MFPFQVIHLAGWRASSYSTFSGSHWFIRLWRSALREAWFRCCGSARYTRLIINWPRPRRAALLHRSPRKVWVVQKAILLRDRNNMALLLRLPSPRDALGAGSQNSSNHPAAEVSHPTYVRWIPYNLCDPGRIQAESFVLLHAPVLLHPFAFEEAQTSTRLS